MLMKPRLILSLINGNAIPVAITNLAQTGAQVINMSFGNPLSTTGDYCTNSPTDPHCLALKEATYRGVALVASSGNDRRFLNFPASDSRAISAGGFDGNIALWHESPNTTTSCPLSSFTTDDGVYLATPECGSNYTTVAGGPRQELMAASKSVLSTTYPGMNWNPALQCGDSFPGPGFGGGQGYCTGPSMLAP